jgi:hypothetical protein
MLTAEKFKLHFEKLLSVKEPEVSMIECTFVIVYKGQNKCFIILKFEVYQSLLLFLLEMIT